MITQEDILDHEGIQRFYINRNFAVIGIVLAILGILIVGLNTGKTGQQIPDGSVYHELMGSLVILSLTYLWSIIQARQYQGLIDNSILKFQYGIIFKETIIIPLNKITDVAISQGILEKAWNVSLMLIETAGSSQTELIILAPKNPNELAELLLSERS